MRVYRTKDGRRVTAAEAKAEGMERLAVGFGRFHSHYAAKDGGGPVCRTAQACWELDDSAKVTCGTCKRIEASPVSRLKIMGAL